MKQLLRFSVSTRKYYAIRKPYFLSLLLIMGLCIAPGISMPSQAAGLDIGALAQDSSSLPTQKFDASPHKKGSLLLLKQLMPNFTTIQSKELTDFKGKLSINLFSSSQTESLDIADTDSENSHRIAPQISMSKDNTLPVPQPSTSEQTTSNQNKAEVSSTPLDNPPMVSQQTPQAKPQNDDNPANMYEFDGGGVSADKEMRSVEAQDAIAEFYNDKMRELADIEDKVNLLAGEYLSNPTKHAAIENALFKANQEQSAFESAWFQHNFGRALTAYENSRATLMKALFDKVPVTRVEARAIWLDRGSIVKAGSPEGMRKLIDRIAASGFNIVYFETINAGYSMYPSKITVQNPEVKGWDPLAAAVQEAHKDGIEIHAWVWTFAVGNTRLNKILGEPASYPGPILSRSDMASEALRTDDGGILPPGQTEYWLSPASYKARSFLLSLFSEVIRNYDVDGLQLDYIRYPFQKTYKPVGFEPFAVSRFTSETGLSLSDPNEYTMKAWDAWKAFQVTTFVKEVSTTLKQINPKLKISAAVFPMNRNNRMLAIQQDWESWVRNGWVDTLNPMAYSKSPRSLEFLVQYIQNVGGDKTLVYPGLSLIKLNPIELLETLEVCRKTGVMGTTLFAYNQFGPENQLLLDAGPYKNRKTIPPHQDPLYSSVQVISETKKIIQSLLSSDQPKPGVQSLQQIEASLDTLGNKMQSLSNSKQQGDLQLEKSVLDNIQDDSRVLAEQADQWTGWSTDSVASFQAKILKQMVDKVVTLVNYTTFEMSKNPQ